MAEFQAGGGNPNKVATFMATKREGMFVGPVQMDNLIRILKEAKAAGKGIVFFLWQNDRGGKAVASLTAAVERDRPDAAPTRNPIGNKGFGASKPTTKAPDKLAGLMFGKKAAPVEDAPVAEEDDF